jgi:ABC-type amino acid transport system permease subunit
MVVIGTGACLGLACSQRSRLVLTPMALRVLAPRDLSQICKYETLT